MLKTLTKTATVTLPSLILGFSAPEALAFRFELEEATVTEINEAFDQGVLTSETLVQLYLNRIAAYDDSGPMINSVLSLNPQALDIAKALDLERQQTGPRSLLHGIPILLKDNHDTFDLPTTGGSDALAGSIPPDDAFAVNLLRDAGAIILGKAEMDEYAISGSGYSSLGGATLNPYRLSRTSGGSSGGTGASVAANFAVFGTGSDTGGSIRTPCSFQGLVCIRPTRGLVSLDGIIPFVLSRDAIGPIARTVEDAAIALSVLAEYDPNNPTLTTPIAPPPVELEQFYDDYTQFLDPTALNGSKLGIVTNYLGLENGVDPIITQLVQEAIRVMTGLGAEVVEVSFEDDFLTTLRNTYGAAIPIEQKIYLEDYLATLSPDYPKTIGDIIAILESPEVANSDTPSIILNTLRNSESLNGDVTNPNYVERAITQTPIVRQTLLDTLDFFNLDAFIFPTVNTFARSAFGTTDPTFNSYPGSAPVRQVEFASSSGLPDITIPIGFDPLGLPVTLSITGRPYSEPTLIGLAYSLEQATLARHPSPLVPSLRGENIVVPESDLLVGLGTVSFVIFGFSRRKRCSNQRN